MDPLVWLVLVALATACAGGYVSTQKRREIWKGIILGAVFGPFGLVVAACLPDDGKTADERAHEAWTREDHDKSEPSRLFKRP